MQISKLTFIIQKNTLTSYRIDFKGSIYFFCSKDDQFYALQQEIIIYSYY